MPDMNKISFFLDDIYSRTIINAIIMKKKSRNIFRIGIVTVLSQVFVFLLRDRFWSLFVFMYLVPSLIKNLNIRKQEKQKLDATMVKKGGGQKILTGECWIKHEGRYATGDLGRD